MKRQRRGVKAFSDLQKGGVGPKLFIEKFRGVL